MNFGIRSSDREDALEFLLAGARAIQAGTANFHDPLASLKVIEGLRDYCQAHQIDRISDLVGTMQPPATH